MILNFSFLFSILNDENMFRIYSRFVSNQFNPNCCKFQIFYLIIKLPIFIYFQPTSGYFDATLTSTRFLYQNDTSFMNSAGLRVQRVKRTYIMTGLFH